MSVNLSTLAERYAADGFVAHDAPAISDDRVAGGAAGVIAVRDGQYDPGTQPDPSPWQPGDDPGKLVKIEQPHYASAALHQAICDPSLGNAIGRIAGARRVQVWHVQGLIKPSAGGADTGPQVGWHQDWQYWRGAWSDDSELMTAWLALSDVTPDSGPIHFVPGSHRWGLLAGGDFFSQEQDALQSALESNLPEGQSWHEVPAPLPPGGFSLHHRLTIHGSGPNTSGRPRISLAIHLCNDHATPNRDHPFGRYIDDHLKCPVIYNAE